MIVSEVGRIAIFSFKSFSPDLVTQATSGAKPSIWEASFFKAASLTNNGK